MHNYDATEIAYKNGYKAGFEAGRKKDGCDFCRKGVKVTAINGTTAEIVHVTPGDSVDLRTGEIVKPAAPGYWALQLIRDGEEDFLPILCCPSCGRVL